MSAYWMPLVPTFQLRLSASIACVAAAVDVATLGEADGAAVWPPQLSDTTRAATMNDTALRAGRVRPLVTGWFMIPDHPPGGPHQRGKLLCPTNSFASRYSGCQTARAVFRRSHSMRRTLVMVEHLLGPLYYERIGRKGSSMVFVHANPMDQSSWMYQMAHLSTWYRCMAIDLPGYGRSPKAAHGLTLSDLAQACWEAADDAGFDGPAVLVGCSAGSLIIAQMHHLRPSRTAALVMSGTGDWPEPEWGELLAARIEGYVEQGVAFRHTYPLAGF